MPTPPPSTESAVDETYLAQFAREEREGLLRRAQELRAPEAENAVDETFRKVTRRVIARKIVVDTLKGYAYTALENVVRDQKRGTRRYDRKVAEYAQSASNDPGIDLSPERAYKIREVYEKIFAACTLDEQELLEAYMEPDGPTEYGKRHALKLPRVHARLVRLRKRLQKRFPELREWLSAMLPPLVPHQATTGNENPAGSAGQTAPLAGSVLGRVGKPRPRSLG